MHLGMRPGGGNMFFNRAPGGSGMQNMPMGGGSGGSCMPGNNSTMMGNGPGGNGYFPPLNPAQTDLPSVSPRTDKSGICKFHTLNQELNRFKDISTFEILTNRTRNCNLHIMSD